MLQTQRNSSFELLRIFSMLLIVMHHYSIFGGFDYMAPFSFRLYFVQCLSMGGKLGVNLFILISGFFLCKSTFKWQRLIKLELEVIFYSLVIAIIFLLTFPERISIKDIFIEITPLRSGNYWFYNAYFLLVLLSPFINKFILNLEKNDFQKLLILLFILWVVIPIFPKVSALEFSNLGWFVFLYLCAAYIRFFSEDFSKDHKFYILIGITFYLLTLLSVLLFDLLGILHKGFQSKFDYFIQMNSLLVFSSSIFLIIGCSKWNTGCKKIINLIASTTFGIYLIHDNHILYSFLWTDFFKNNLYISTNKIYIHAVCVISIVFIGCSIIDFLRQIIFEKPLFIIIEKIKNIRDNKST